MALVSSSGTTSFAPALGELVLDAFARIQIRAPSLTTEHWWNARMSANLLFSEFSNVGMPLLWRIAPVLIVLQPGVSQYAAPSNIIAPLDAYIRTFQLGTAVDFDPVFTADAGSTTVTVTQTAHGYGAGDLVFYGTALAASGQVIQGSYLVATVVDADNYQIEVPSPMDGTNTAVLPVFMTTDGSTSVSITLANHGLSVGKSFYCNVPVTVGGLTLSGQLIVTGVSSVDVFQITAGANAGTSGSATQNGGQMQAQGEAPGVDPLDYVCEQVSRSDYIGQPDKGPNLQYRPTAFWFDRRRSPTVSFWNPPDSTQPYCFVLYAMIQPEDSVIEGGVGVDVPYRYLAAFGAGMAYRLSQKYPPDPQSGATMQALKDDYTATLQAALLEDIERVPLYLAGGMQSYYR